MVALKLILQSLAVVVAVSGAVGGTFALSNKTATTQTDQTKEQTQQTETEPESEKAKEKPESSTITPPQNTRTIPWRLRVKQEIKITEVPIKTNNQTTKDFYLVSVYFEHGIKKPEIDLFSDANLTEKNYQCVKSSHANPQTEETMRKDTSCILYSLKNNTSTALKTSEIQKFIQNTNETSNITSQVTQKSQISQNKFFLLQANDNLIQFAANRKLQTVYLTAKDVTSLTYETNNLGTLTVHAKISANEVLGKTDAIIAKVTGNKQNSTNADDDLFPNYQCSFNSEIWKTNCSVSKLSQYTTPTNSFNFSSETIKNRPQQTVTEINSYYFIQSSGIKSHPVKTLKGSTATYFEAQTNASPFSTPLSIEAPVFAKFNSGGTRIAELIILDK